MKVNFQVPTKLKKLLLNSLKFSAVLIIGFISGVFVQRNDSLKIYLNYLIDELAFHYKKSTTTNISKNSGSLILNIRKLELSRNKSEYDTEHDSKYILKKRKLYPKRTALILIDIWDTEKEANDGFKDRHNRFVLNKIIPLIKLARKLGVQIVHSPHGYPISKHIEILPQDLVLDVNNLPFHLQSLSLYRLLKERGICTLLYAGNSTHKCLFDRPDGIYGMRKLLDDFVLVRDATMAFEYHSTIEGELVKEVFTNYIEESYGSSTTINDISMSLNSVVSE